MQINVKTKEENFNAHKISVKVIEKLNFANELTRFQGINFAKITSRYRHPAKFIY